MSANATIERKGIVIKPNHSKYFVVHGTPVVHGRVPVEIMPA